MAERREDRGEDRDQMPRQHQDIRGNQEESHRHHRQYPGATFIEGNPQEFQQEYYPQQEHQQPRNAGPSMIEGYSQQFYHEGQSQQHQYQHQQQSQRGYTNEYHHQYGHYQYQQPPLGDYPGSQQPHQAPPSYAHGGDGGAYGEQGQYYDPYGYYQENEGQGYYPPYEDQYQYGDYDDADLSNLDEIDKALALASIGIEGSDDEIPELIQTPSGALPSVNGVLTTHAAQFWFPECRDCSCCAGFKHGCKCCVSGVQVCSCVSQKPSQVTATTATTSPTAAESTTTAATEASPTAEVTTIAATEASPKVEIPVSSKITAPPPPPVKKSLVVQAPDPRPSSSVSQGPGPQGEYWFPECRACTCCEGFKFGCQCCKSGARTCSCVAAQSGVTGPSSSGASVSNKSNGECTYFKSPGGCQKGDRCRFRHTN